MAYAEALTHMLPEQSSDHILDQLSKYFPQETNRYPYPSYYPNKFLNRMVRSAGPVPGKDKVQELEKV